MVKHEDTVMVLKKNGFDLPPKKEFIYIKFRDVERGQPDKTRLKS